MAAVPELLVKGLSFPEGPRWHGDRLWFSDVLARTVVAARLDGTTDVVLRLSDSPSGLGFLPDGTPIVVSMYDRKLLRLLGDDRAEVHADLRDFPGDYLNDMVIDGDGIAYVGMRSSTLLPGFPIPTGDRAPDSILAVRPDGACVVAARHLVSPNGSVITPDGRMLIVAETYAHRLLAFDRASDGSLGNRRVFAAVGDDYPDGICLDAEGGVWIGSPYTSTFLRVRDGSEQTARLRLPGAVACTLGAADRRLLFLLGVDPAALRVPGDATARRSSPTDRSVRSGHIWTMPVEHAGVGWP